MIEPDAPAPDRRRFLKLLTWVGMSSVLASQTVGFAAAQSSKDAKPTTKPATPPPATPMPAPADSTATPKPPSDDAKALASIVERRYGKYLTPEQLEKVTRDLDQRIQSGRRMRDVVLRNDEEPDTVFRP
jgi:hypothetical protein